MLVIGGTGLLGAPVVRQLRGDGYRVRVLVRTLPAAPDGNADLEYVEGDLDDTAALRRALAGCAAVHVSVRGGPTAQSYDRVEHRGPARVAELAAQAGVGRLTDPPGQVRGTRAVVLGRQPHPFHLLAASDFAAMVSRPGHAQVGRSAPGRARPPGPHHRRCPPDRLRAARAGHAGRDQAAVAHDRAG